ncbi:unnamed protein product [Arabidopsis thaliana]|uniref:NYN domain-containing protein n=1 Tax=Arabidopsis thaliana TaxID=3702 RepID=A0A5S9XJC6_ARATH|nr:unnamed protein product [Arabidopsis thaliana]
MLLKLFQQSRFFKSISGLGNVASPSHGFVGTRASRPPAVFGTHYLRLLATDSSPPNDTIGPQYGDPVRLPGYPQPNLCTAKTEIWWDVDSCRLPDSVDPYRLVGNLRKSLNEKGYRGPITSINAFGNTNRIDETTMLALSATGVYTRHIPDGRKESAHKKILVDLLCFGMDNIQQPCNIMLISGNRDYSDSLHQLKSRLFNILLAQPEDFASTPLIHAASTAWIWSSLVLGGKHLSPSQVEDLLAHTKKRDE